MRNDEALTVGRHSATAIGGDESARTGGQRVLYVGGDAHATVQGELRERIGGTRSLTVEGEQHQRVSGSAALESGEAIHLKAGTTLVLEGGDITLRGPGGFIRIDASGVTIDGAAVRLQDGGAPGAGPGARPAAPLLPPGAEPTRAPRRLPLLELPGVARKDWPGHGQPLNHHHRFLCTIACQCVDAPKPQNCMTKKLRDLDRSVGGMSPYKAEVHYDMSQDPPQPIMSNNDPDRPSTRNPKGNKCPDVTVVEDPAKPFTRDNIEEIVEFKFGNDTLDRTEQLEPYQQIAGEDIPFRVLTDEDCGCPRRKRERSPVPDPVTSDETVEVVLLTVAIIAMVLDDLVPGGQADDVLIPAALARLAPTLSRLMSKLLPRLGETLRPVPVVP